MAEYALGQSEEALKRLIDQAAFVGPITERMLRAAGVGPGMRVLDIGCGAGDVTFQTAELVKANGHVLGVDMAGEPIRMAWQRAKAAGLANVTFREGTEADLDAEAPFDCIIGRYVLIYQPNPVDFVRRLAAQLRPGGTLALQEVDFTHPIAAIPPMAKLDRMLNEIVAIMARTAADVGSATRMAGIFAEAGLPAPSGFCERTIGMEGARTFFRWAASSYAVLQSRISPESDPVDVDRLVGEFLADVAAVHGCAHGPDQWCAWTIRA
ncbi:class I SAM-dependent methyltransferase [Methylobacterium sp. J-077]|uniref:class I SAM-dependent methyltransferase n=1 Tax=Methylobacterium sp. J-077 TaxID=2836656 RepID=UPI001FB99323|nr:class I SAM-dependent methyltransferase [Methylobacterium sp. J-077]MCJ2124947.1 class I SAM-dependent methyltransferase [Methylobacterium sp. J-077]